MASKMKYYIQAMRPKTLPASLSPVLVGVGFTHYMGHPIRPLFIILAGLGAILLQISSNLVNDYFDGRTGVDKNRSLGPERVTHQKLLTPQQIKYFFITTFVLAFAIVFPLIIYTGIPMILLTLSCFLAAYLYTGGPLPLSYVGLGEVLAYLFFGPLAVWGIFLTQTQVLSYETFYHAFIFGSATGFISAQIMSINNYRDQEEDSHTTKKTLAIFLGKFAKFLPVTFLFLSLLFPIALFPHRISIYLLLLVPIPFLSRWKCLLWESPSQKYNVALAATGQYMFIHALTFTFILIFG